MRRALTSEPGLFFCCQNVSDESFSFFPSITVPVQSFSNLQFRGLYSIYY